MYKRKVFKTWTGTLSKLGLIVEMTILKMMTKPSYLLYQLQVTRMTHIDWEVVCKCVVHL